MVGLLCGLTIRLTGLCIYPADRFKLSLWSPLLSLVWPSLDKALLPFLDSFDFRTSMDRSS